MILTERQKMFLFTLLKDTLTKNVVGYLCYSPEDRVKMLDEIINQQPNDVHYISGYNGLKIDGGCNISTDTR